MREEWPKYHRGFRCCRVFDSTCPCLVQIKDQRIGSVDYHCSFFGTNIEAHSEPDDVHDDEDEPELLLIIQATPKCLKMAAELDRLAGRVQ